MRRLTLTTLLLLALATPAYGCTYEAWCGKSHSARYNRAVIRRVAARRHYTRSQTDALVWLAGKESTWRNTATNGPCLGLFQHHTHVPKRTWASPVWQTYRTIRYVEARYGGIAGAVAHSRRAGWY